MAMISAVRRTPSSPDQEIAPVVALFALIERYLVGGLTAGSVK